MTRPEAVSPSVPTTQGEREALDAQHFDGVSCIQCGHAVAEHVGNPCCRVCFGEGKRGRHALCVRDEKCPVDGQLATKHEGWTTP